MKEENVAVVLAVINILGLATFLLIPFLSTILGLSEMQGGIWAGAVIHAVPQAVAAGDSIGEEGMVIATAIKLARVGLVFVVPSVPSLVNESVKPIQQKRLVFPFLISCQDL